MNSHINDEFKVSQKYKKMCNSRIREVQATISDRELPKLTEDRSRLERELMQKVLEFENKVQADGYRLQGLVKTELSILSEELAQEEMKRREFD